MTESWLSEVRQRLARDWPERPALRGPDASSTPLRSAAVLVPLYPRDGHLVTLFTRRTDLVEHHKGQISFPGGAVHDALVGAAARQHRHRLVTGDARAQPVYDALGVAIQVVE